MSEPAARAAGDRVVIAGGGPAAWRCAFSLRDLGFEGALTIVCEEPRSPYDRTMVSKDCLTRSPEESELALAAAEAYAEGGIELRLGVAATAVDTARRRVSLSDGDALEYDALLVATGGRARLPEGLRCDGIHVLRTFADAAAFDRDLAGAERVAVVGGGLIAGEVATSALARGAQVTMLEALEAPLVRVVGPVLGKRVEELHRRAGVDVRTGAAVESIEPAAGGGYAIALSGGDRVDADAVVVAVGIAPAVDWLAGADGIELDGGVVADASCRTGAPGVFAAGDCARWLDVRTGRHVRTEHWDTASRHGEAAAASIMGSAEPFTPVPFAWSVQHGTRLQWIGDTAGADRVEVEELDPGLVARYWRGGALTGGFAIDSPRSIGRLRRELLSGPVTTNA